MSNIAIVIHSNKDASEMAKVGQGVSNLVRVLGLIKGLISGAVVGSAYVHTGVASATATLATVVADNTITIGGVTLTAKASPADQTQFAVGASNTECAAALAAAINAHTTLKHLVYASASAAVVTISAVVPGPVGNQIPVSRVGSPITLSGAALAGASVTPEKVR